MRVWTIGIVGGGPGGLMTSYLLQSLASEPFQATIFEASPRLGGKVLTSQFSLAPAPYEVGAAELYDYSPVGEDSLRELVAELGLATIPMRGSAVIMHNRVISNLDDVARHLGTDARTALLEFDRQARDRVSPAEFYHSGQSSDIPGEASPERFDRCLATISNIHALEYVETLIHSDLATEPSHTNISYGLHNYVMNHPAYMQLYSIEGGNERLTQELALRSRARKLLNQPVISIARGPTGQLRLTSNHQGREHHDLFDVVVVALPTNGLSRVRFEGDRLSNALARHQQHHNHPAHYLRVTALFDRPFWRGTFDDSYCMLDQLGGCCLYDESSRTPGSTHSVLGWLIGGAAAESMSHLPDDELIRKVMDALPESLQHGRQNLLEARVHRWVGAVSAMPGGEQVHSLEQRHQPEPVEHPNLFLVGDYLFDSTLNGVLDSAEYVARWIAAQMADSRPRAQPMPHERAGRSTHHSLHSSTAELPERALCLS